MAEIKEPTPDTASVPDQADTAAAEFELQAAEAVPVERSEPALETEPAAEPAVEPEAEPEAAARPEPAPPAPRPSGGFAPALLGGVVSAGLGFGLAWYGADQGWPIFARQNVQADQLAQELPALRAEMDTLRAELAARPDSTALADLESRMPQVDPTLPAQMEALNARLSALENLPLGESGTSAAGLAVFEAELGELRARLDAQQGQVSAEIEAAMRERLAAVEAEADTARQASAQEVQRAAQTAAVIRIRSALDAGLPYAAELTDLRGLGAEVPAALDAAQAQNISLVSLQQGFSTAARAALDAALRADMGDTMTERLGSFLRSQTGARSLTPREGNDPDAVLSRMEAALHAGQVQQAHAMLPDLPEAAQQVLADWAEAANTYLAARAALDALATPLE